MDPNLMAETLSGKRMIQPQPVNATGGLERIAEFIRSVQSRGKAESLRLGEEIHQRKQAGVPYPGAFDFARKALVWLEQKGIPATQENIQAVVQAMAANPAAVDMAAAPPDPSLGPPQMMATDAPMGTTVPIPPEAQAPMQGDPMLPQSQQMRPMGDPMLPQFRR